MWIKSQDKKRLVNIIDIRIEKSLKKFYIFGTPQGVQPSYDPVQLGIYTCEEDALNQLRAIEECIISSRLFYSMN